MVGGERPSLDAIGRLWSDLGSATGVDEAAQVALGWIGAALAPGAFAAIARPDAGGRLRIEWQIGDRPEAGRERAARRRMVFASRRSTQLRLPGPAGGSTRHTGGVAGPTVGMIPLVCRGESLGILEVASANGHLEEAWPTLEAIASHLAFAFLQLREREELRREVERLERAAGLGRELVRARTAETAFRVAVRFVSERFGVPAAGWCEGDDESLVLTSAEGLSAGRRRELLRRMPTLPRWESLPLRERRAVSNRFRELADVRAVSVIEVGRGLLLAGSPVPRLRGSLDAMGAFLGDVLRLLSAAAAAEQANERLDMGLAWTAHELRTPLIGVRAMLELLLGRDRIEPGDLELLRRSLTELSRLSGTAEDLLVWASGARPLRRRQTDLVGLVEEAAESCRLETGRDVVVSGPDRALAAVDASNLRTAIVNILRNALAYGQGTKVEIQVSASVDEVIVSVTDQGPGIRAAERESIFDPFVRGSLAGRAHNGSGLGLFIARRVIEAHGGRIWVGSDRGGTTFRVVLPLERRRERRSVS
jgi:signal transduction histidine kinase